MIANAVKFNVQDGQINIDVSTNVDETELTCIVSDTGIGIEDEKIRTLFGVFKSNLNHFGQYKSKDFATSGVGIGLTNAKILCEGLSGNIELTSRVGQGTSVTFTVAINQKLKAFSQEFTNRYSSTNTCIYANQLLDLQAIKGSHNDGSKVSHFSKEPDSLKTNKSSQAE